MGKGKNLVASENESSLNNSRLFGFKSRDTKRVKGKKSKRQKTMGFGCEVLREGVRADSAVMGNVGTS